MPQGLGVMSGYSGDQKVTLKHWHSLNTGDGSVWFVVEWS